MQYFSAIIFVLFFGVLYGQQEIDSCKISYSQQFEFALSIDESGRFAQAKEALESVLYKRDTILLVADQGNELVQFVYDELFPSHLQGNEMEFQFLNIGEIDRGIVMTIIMRQDLSQFGEEYENMLYVHYIYRAILIETKQGYKLDCSLQLDEFEVSENAFGKYLYNPNRTNKKDLSIKNYKFFSKNILNTYHLKHPKKELTYVVSDRNDAMKIFGFSYSLNVTGMYIRKLGILINCTSTPLDKHELTHYLLESFDLGKFLSEGIAVYHGGSQGTDHASFFEIQKNTFNQIDQEEKQNWLSMYKEGLLQGGPYNPFFYAVSGQLISEFIEHHGEEGLKEIVRVNPNITPEKFIEQYLLGGGENVDMYIKNILEK
jgi:hypothetical protein